MIQEIMLQLHGGGGGGGGGDTHTVKQSAPGASVAATIENSSKDAREEIRDKLSKAKGRNATNKTGGAATVDTVKKILLGE